MRRQSPLSGERNPTLWRKKSHSAGASVLDWRGGAYDRNVYVCESKDMDERKRLLKPEVYNLRVEEVLAQEEFVVRSVSTRMRALNTTGDGACGMHAFFGEPKLRNCGYFEMQISNPREMAARYLGPSLEDLVFEWFR